MLERPRAPFNPWNVNEFPGPSAPALIREAFRLQKVLTRPLVEGRSSPLSQVSASGRGPLGPSPPPRTARLGGRGPGGGGAPPRCAEQRSASGARQLARLLRLGGGSGLALLLFPLLPGPRLPLLFLRRHLPRSLLLQLREGQSCLRVPGLAAAARPQEGGVCSLRVAAILGLVAGGVRLYERNLESVRTT